jgi:predicted dehydrogenase
MTMMKVGIIGAGLQCKRRAPFIAKWPHTELAAIASLCLEDARKAANQFHCEAADNWEQLVQRDDIDIILVCTPPYVHAELSIMAMKNGKHVLCEKPLTRNIQEAEEMIKTSEATKRILKCGFNHRHHPAVLEAHKIMEQGLLGKLLFGRCRYGIIGRPGYEEEWRANPAMASGGQFIEQGTHAIDLFRWFFGEISEVSCMTGVQFFTGQSLDDNGMALFRAKNGALLTLHASLTQWKNLFSLEIFGEEGYVIIEGLGSSYGTEKLIYGKKDYNAPFNDHLTEYRGGDSSWEAEWKEFCEAIANQRLPMGNGYDGLAAMRIALACYEAEKNGKVIKLQ